MNVPSFRIPDEEMLKSVVGVGALNCFRCFNTLGFVTGRALKPEYVLLQNKCSNKTDG